MGGAYSFFAYSNSLSVLPAGLGIFWGDVKSWHADYPDPVPEPATVALVGSGLLLCLRGSRSSRKRTRWEKTL
jgi:hypothetical protein